MLIHYLLRYVAVMLAVCALGIGAAAGLGRLWGGNILAVWALVNTGRDYDIFLVDARAQIAYNLTHQPESDSGFTWSPDGTHLAYIERRNHNYAVRVVNATGRTQQRIPMQFAPVTLDWSPDGSQWAAVGEIRGLPDIHLGDVSGGAWRNITTSIALSEGNINWSPDSNHLVYTTERSRIWLMELASGNRQQIAENAQFSAPKWSPDGTRIAYFRWNGAVELFDVPTGNKTVLENAYPPRTLPMWSPDGIHLAFVARRTPDLLLRLMNVATGTARDIALPFEDVTNASWSPDGQKLFICATMSQPVYSTSVYALDVASGAIQRLTDASFVAVYALAQP